MNTEAQVVSNISENKGKNNEEEPSSTPATVASDKGEVETKIKKPFVFTEKRKQNIVKANAARKAKKEISTELGINYQAAKEELRKAYSEASKKLVLDMSTKKEVTEVNEIPVVKVIPDDTPIGKSEVKKEAPVESEDEAVKIDKKTLRKVIKKVLVEDIYNSDTDEEIQVKKKKKKMTRKVKPDSSEEESEEEKPVPKKKRRKQEYYESDTEDEMIPKSRRNVAVKPLGINKFVGSHSGCRF